MKKVDFVFSYEVKARELESVCMIKQELENRGYTTAVLNTWKALNERPLDVEAEVLVLSACYRTRTLESFVCNVRNYHKVFNLQWEQIRSVESEQADPDDENSNYSVTGRAREAVHVSWGQKNYDRLTKECHVPERNVVLAGHPALDFLRPDLVSYYKSREELFREYQLPTDKKVCLFISSFAIIGRPESEVKVDQSFGEQDSDKRLDVALRSQTEIIHWFRRAMEQSDTVFIYRPHPTEVDNPELKALEAEFPNFRVIKEESVKQWILTCDVIYNWNSTALAEIFMCGKSCYMLRPVPLPDFFNSSIFAESDSIRTEEEFLATLQDPNPAFPITEDKLRYYYYIPEDQYSYEIICDALERVYHDPSYRINGAKQYYARDKVIRRFWDALAAGAIGAFADEKLPAAADRIPPVRKVRSKIRARRAQWANPEATLSDFAIERRKIYDASPQEIEEMCQRMRELTKNRRENRGGI